MRTKLLLIPMFLGASPALAQAPVAPKAAPDTAQIQRVLNDPAMADRMARVMQAMSRSFMNLPVGEVQAAVEGRAPTAAERRMTVRDMGRRDNRNFERDVQQQMANARPMLEQGMKALGEALPAMMQGMTKAGEAIERATANLPDPTYPKR
ncbi:hypothetical protein H9L13_03755 [Sphingomonas lutea]|uniref:Spy/CpxP family protein refolding chaperone n=1 Tax=Sphingomonas lutea TaxID=1045317 RepID=A0A7G9SJK6_9SPHN|nr:hypothetical protein [Sphingomonas lutea]QNN68031.1 hypothetical protein H9L13_03755 [Sphingomonas lutea]